jgi:hypothetical protein
MKLSKLLSNRPDLLRQVRLANLAFAYESLRSFAERIERGALTGMVTLKPADATNERYCATLTALEHNQSVIEEHFTDEDLMLLADVIAFATGHPGFEVTFHLEDLDEDFIAPLRAELSRAGVVLDFPTRTVEEKKRTQAE